MQNSAGKQDVGARVIKGKLRPFVVDAHGSLCVIARNEDEAIEKALAFELLEGCAISAREDTGVDTWVFTAR